MNKKPITALGIVTISFMTGILLNGLFIWSFTGKCIILALLIVILSMVGRSTKLFLLTLMVGYVLLGMIYSHSYQYLSRDHIGYVYKKTRTNIITAQGTVVSPIKVSQVLNTNKYSFELQLKSVRTRQKYLKTRGKVLVQLFRPTAWNYGDVIEITGKIHRPFEFSANSNFSYRQYLKNKNIHYVMSIKNKDPVQTVGIDKIYWLRAFSQNIRLRLRRELSAYLTDNESGIMQAILLGERGNIPKHIRVIFHSTGTAHILAISGLHVGIVALLILTLLNVSGIRRYYQLYLTILFLIVYVFVTGARPSVVRASIMSIIFIGGIIRERESESMNMLYCAALIILLVNPLYVNDVGFQLSFICVLGIILLSPKLLNRFKARAKGPWRGVKAWFCNAMSVSIAVWIAVGGMVAYYFEIITPITPIANLIVIPLVIIVVYLGCGLLTSAIFLPWVAPFFAICIKIVLNILVGSIFLLHQIPCAYFQIKDISPWHLIVYYLIIVVIFYGPWGIIFKKPEHLTTIDKIEAL